MEKKIIETSEVSESQQKESIDFDEEKKEYVSLN